MSQKGVLSSKFNMSLGFIPVIISIILYEFMTKDIAIYIGAGVGILYSLSTAFGKGKRIPHFILYGTTVMLLLLTVSTLLFGDCCPSRYYPFTLEICAIIPAFIFYLNKKTTLKDHAHKQAKYNDANSFSSGTISAIVSTRVVLLIASVHFIVIAIAFFFFRPLGRGTEDLLFRFFPPVVFLISILFNQYGIRFFNKLMERNAFVPIVNTKGDVIGRQLAADVIREKSSHMHPVIRIAISYKDMLFLAPRSQQAIIERGKTDIPMETYLLYGETLEAGVKRLMQYYFPNMGKQNVQFNAMYNFENNETNRLIYLFLLEVTDESYLHEKTFKESKLWTPLQIKYNLGKNFFSSCFEHEYEHLREVIDTREKYREF